jgi:hypothetical protein
MKHYVEIAVLPDEHRSGFLRPRYCQPKRDAQNGGMFWVITISAIAAALLLVAVALRKYVCFRSKDCCGQGCGCIFPSKQGRMNPPR